MKAYVFISCSDILITNLDASMSYDELCDEVHEMCNLQQEQPITLKWIDDEGIVLKYCFEVFSGSLVIVVRRRGITEMYMNKFPIVELLVFKYQGISPCLEAGDLKRQASKRQG